MPVGGPNHTALLYVDSIHVAVGSFFIITGIEEGNLNLRTLDTNSPPTDGNGWLLLFLTIFGGAILISVGWFFKERVIR